MHLTHHDVHDHGDCGFRLFSNHIFSENPISNTSITIIISSHHDHQNVERQEYSPHSPPDDVNLLGYVSDRQTSARAGGVPSITASPPLHRALLACRIHFRSLTLPLTALPSDCSHRLMPKSALEGEKEGGEEERRRGASLRSLSLCLVERARVASRASLSPRLRAWDHPASWYHRASQSRVQD